MSCRITPNTANIDAAVSGDSRQSRPANVTWTTCCPAPKQSKTAQPGKPRSRWYTGPRRQQITRAEHDARQGMTDSLDDDPDDARWAAAR